MSIITTPITRLTTAIKRTSSYAVLKSKSTTGKVVFRQVKGRTKDGRNEETRQQTKDSRPIVVVKVDYGQGLSIDVIGSENTIGTNGTLELYVEANVSDFVDPKNVSDEDSIEVWAKFVGEFAYEIVAECVGRDGEVLGQIRNLTIVRIGRSPLKERESLGEYFGAVFRITWGTNAV